MEKVGVKNHQSASIPSRKKFLGHIKQQPVESDLRMIGTIHLS
jgi:hypothetical protein